MTIQMLFIVVALGAIPVISRLMRELIQLIVKLVAGAFVAMFVLLVLIAILSHSKLI